MTPPSTIMTMRPPRRTRVCGLLFLGILYSLVVDFRFLFGGKSSWLSLASRSGWLTQDYHSAEPLPPFLPVLLQVDQPSFKTAIVLISLGNSTQSPLVERCLRSIRVGGNWTGPVFVIAENTTRYQHLVSNTNGMEPGTPAVHVLPVRPEHIHTHNSSVHIKTLHWMVKSRVLEYLPVDFQYVLYMDIDVVVAQDLHAFVEHYDEERNNRIDVLDQYQGYAAMFYEDFKHEHHAGVILLERGRSEPCMELWRQKFQENPQILSDQRFLRFINQDLEQRTCRLLSLNRHEHLLFPMPRFLGRLETKTFVHFTSHGVVRIAPRLHKWYLSSILNISHPAGEESNLEYLTEVTHF